MLTLAKEKHFIVMIPCNLNRNIYFTTFYVFYLLG